MSEKPQEARAEDREDLLEQIITQGLDKLNVPTQAEDREAETAATPRQDSRETAPPADNKNRRSAVYLYLVVLFGAAFLMLLLAYFVQRRSSEDALSDLRDLNLSRTELLEEIRELEEQKAALEVQNAALEITSARLSDELSQWQERNEELFGELTDLVIQNDKAHMELYGWASLWAMEELYLARDYENCAAVMISQARNTMSRYDYRTPDAAQERYAEIVRAVIDAGILDEDYAQHPLDYEYLLDAYFERFGSWPPER